MRDQGDRTVAVMDELKKRRDVLVDDSQLKPCCASAWNGDCTR